MSKLNNRCRTRGRQEHVSYSQSRIVQFWLVMQKIIGITITRSKLKTNHSWSVPWSSAYSRALLGLAKQQQIITICFTKLEEQNKTLIFYVVYWHTAGYGWYLKVHTIDPFHSRKLFWRWWNQIWWFFLRLYHYFNLKFKSNLVNFRTSSDDDELREFEKLILEDAEKE